MDEIDIYFPKTSENEKDRKLRQILINFCNKHKENIDYKATSWDAFKKWARCSFKVLMKDKEIGQLAVIEEIAKKRISHNNAINNCF